MRTRQIAVKQTRTPAKAVPVYVDQVAQAERDGGSTFSMVGFAPEAQPQTRAPRRRFVREAMIGGVTLVAATAVLAAVGVFDRGSGSAGANIIGDQAAQNNYDDGINSIRGGSYETTVQPGDYGLEIMADRLATLSIRHGASVISPNDLLPYMHELPTKGPGIVTGDDIYQLGERVGGFVPPEDRK